MSVSTEMNDISSGNEIRQSSRALKMNALASDWPAASAGHDAPARCLLGANRFLPHYRGDKYRWPRFVSSFEVASMLYFAGWRALPSNRHKLFSVLINSAKPHYLAIRPKMDAHAERQCMRRFHELLPPGHCLRPILTTSAWPSGSACKNNAQ